MKKIDKENEVLIKCNDVNYRWLLADISQPKERRERLKRCLYLKKKFRWVWLNEGCVQKPSKFSKIYEHAADGSAMV